MYQADKSIVGILQKYKILCSDDGDWDTPGWFYLPQEYGTSENFSIYYDFYNSRKPKEHAFYKLSTDYKSLFKIDKEVSDFIVKFVNNLCLSRIKAAKIISK